ncbi:type II secretion system protein [Candidatus Omnitrophota bacterium]
MTLLAGKKNNKGILLLEVLVSVAILSVCFVFIISSFTRSIRVINLSGDYFRVGLVLEQELYEALDFELKEDLPDFDKIYEEKSLYPVPNSKG